MRKYFFIFLILLLSFPTFLQMLRPGIFSMQDFHYFRLLEFDKCIRALQIPCRWAADSGAGYGEPIFNFYGQFVYVFGEVIHLIGASLIDSLKFTFIFSLVASGIGMFFLSRKIWGNNLAGLISAALYLYAPYRAVDVWVRGALPEAFSFVFFPLIILQLENYLESRNKKNLLLFSLLIGLLIITHNLSVILFAPFLITWVMLRFFQTKKKILFVHLFLAGLFAIVLSAFYILPVIFESKFVDINSTTVGYFDWRIHFVTLKQLFISRFWGYGGSTWGDGDGLSLSLGQMQYLIPIITAVIIVLKKKATKENVTFFVLVLIGSVCLFLTHNKSTFIWINLPFMKYIQFPWRFLGVSVFAFALASGKIVKDLNKKTQIIISGVIIILAIALNFSFFRPDIWYIVSDRDLQTGPKWDEARFSSLPDYWPNFGHKYPDKISDGKYINYFPGWNYTPDKNGLIPAKEAVFENTEVRTVGNTVSLIAFVIWGLLFVKLKYAKNS